MNKTLSCVFCVFMASTTLLKFSSTSLLILWRATNTSPNSTSLTAPLRAGLNQSNSLSRWDLRGANKSKRVRQTLVWMKRSFLLNLMVRISYRTYQKLLILGTTAGSNGQTNFTKAIPTNKEIKELDPVCHGLTKLWAAWSKASNSFLNIWILKSSHMMVLCASLKGRW